MWNLNRNVTNELQNRTDSQKDGDGIIKGFKHTAVFKADNQQGPTVQDRELCSMCAAVCLEGEAEREWIQ